jgi:hypothetical protein
MRECAYRVICSTLKAGYVHVHISVAAEAALKVHRIVHVVLCSRDSKRALIAAC